MKHLIGKILKYINQNVSMNYLLNSPSLYQDWKIEPKINTCTTNTIEYSKKKFTKSDIAVYKNIISKKIYNNVLSFKSDIMWTFGYYNNKNLIYNDKENINEIHHFYTDVQHNIFFTNLFYKIILPQIEIENKDKVKIDNIFITGQLHGLSDLFHRDNRSTNNYGPSVYLFMNDNWKSYYDGSLCFLLDEESKELYHEENIENKIVVFPPGIYHRSCEISGYGLFENALNTILQFHLIYE